MGGWVGRMSKVVLSYFLMGSIIVFVFENGGVVWQAILEKGSKGDFDENDT